MSGFYEGLRDNSAKNLLIRFGRTFTLKRIVTSSYVPGGQVTTNTTSYTVTGVMLDFSEKLLAAGLVKVGEKKVIIGASGLAITPEQNDKITIDSYDWTIVAVKTTSPAGIAVIHELRVRK